MSIATTNLQARKSIIAAMVPGSLSTDPPATVMPMTWTGKVRRNHSEHNVSTTIPGAEEEDGAVAEVVFAGELHD